MRIVAGLVFCLLSLSIESQGINDEPNILRESFNRFDVEEPARDNQKEKTPWYHLQHLKIQYAGSIGFLSVGGGSRIGKSYEPSVFYGLLSQTFGGSSVTVHTVSLKNSFYLTDTPWLNVFYPKAGVSVNWGNTGNTFRKLPPHYPERYYFQNMVHVAPFWGGEWHIPFGNQPPYALGVYFEFSVLDAYLLEALRTDYVKMRDIWSLGLGLTFYWK
jgi:hypothetical protein